MAPNRSARRSRGKREPAETERETPASQLFYRGPLKPLGSSEQQHLTTTYLATVGNFTSSAGGVLNNVFNSNPSACTNWSDLATSFHEFRVLGMRLEYFPINRYSKTTTNCEPMVGITDRTSDVTALTSYGQAIGHESATKESLEDPWIREVRMNSSEEAQFQETVAPAVVFSMKFYADTLTINTPYGKYFLYYLVQFRGRA